MKISINKSSSGIAPNDGTITSDKGILMDNIEIQIDEDVSILISDDKLVIKYEENRKMIEIKRLGNSIKATKS